MLSPTGIETLLHNLEENMNVSPSRAWGKTSRPDMTGMEGVAQFSILRPRQNGSYFADDLSKCIFVFENV